MTAAPEGFNAATASAADIKRRLADIGADAARKRHAAQLEAARAVGHASTLTDAEYRAALRQLTTPAR